MSATEEPIALTLVPEQRRYSPAPPKRKASSSPQRSVSGALKRLKRSPSPLLNGRSPSRGRTDGSMVVERRGPVSQEEKRRGMRLFGGLLSTLSQPKTSSQQQRRRQEIEQRQMTEHQQKEGVGRLRYDDPPQRAENAVRAAYVQKTQQLELDELVMKRRHGSLRIMARSLRTVAEPSLVRAMPAVESHPRSGRDGPANMPSQYYLPWKLTKGHQETIDQQTRAIEALIGRETQAFARRREIHARQGSSLQTVQPSAPSERGDKRDAAQPQENDQQKSVALRRNGDDNGHDNSVDWGEEKTTYAAGGSRPEAENETGLTHMAGDSSQSYERRLKTDWSGALKDERDDESGDVVEEGHEDEVIY